MSYDVYLKDPITKNVIELGFKHQMAGGTYVVGCMGRRLTCAN